MSHVVEATYENGVLKLAQPLPLKHLERVRVTVESLPKEGHSIMDIPTFSVGAVLNPLSASDDLLGEMLEDR